MLTTPDTPAAILQHVLDAIDSAASDDEAQQALARCRERLAEPAAGKPRKRGRESVWWHRGRQYKAVRSHVHKAWTEEDERKHPRGEGGKFGSGSGSGTASKTPATPGSDEALTELVAHMDGLMPHLDELVVKAIDDGYSVSQSVSDWDELDSDDQDKARDRFVDENEDSYYDSEVESWAENLSDEASEDVKQDQDWAEETFRAWAEDNGFDADSARDAIQSYRYGNLKIDETKLKLVDEPDEPVEDAETGESRWDGGLDSDWDQHFDSAKDSEIDRRVRNMEDNPPDNLRDSARELAEESWDNLSDSNKFDFAQENGLADDVEIPLEQPGDYQPFSDGEDYQRSRGVALFLQEARTEELLKERSLPSDLDLDKLPAQVWGAWKGSSTSPLGLALQVAASEELNGHLRLDDKGKQTAEEALVKLADTVADTASKSLDAAAKVQLGKDILKIHARATWEASQYVLRKAGVDELEVYRGLMMDKGLVESDGGKTDTPEGTKLAGIRLQKNGAASTTNRAATANGWSGVGTVPPNSVRVVLRVAAPPEAALSLPVFGQNLYDEQETVVVGVKWNSWDAWLDRAPDASKVKIKSMSVAYRPKKERGKLVVDLLEADMGQPHWLSGNRDESQEVITPTEEDRHLGADALRQKRDHDRNPPK